MDPLDQDLPKQGECVPPKRNWYLSLVDRHGVAISAFLLGAVLFSAIAIFVNRQPAKRNLPTLVQSNAWFEVMPVEIKLLDSDLRKSLRGNAVVAKDGEVAVQWRCEVLNNGNQPVRCRLAVRFFDSDWFVLATSGGEYVFEATSDPQLRFQESGMVSDEILLTKERYRRIARCEVRTEAFKTPAELAAEYQARTKQVEAARLSAEAERSIQQQAAEAARAAEAAQRQALREAERGRIAARRNAWKQLSIGMDQQSVVRLLGRPDSVQRYEIIGDSWYYQNEVGGSLGTVSFDARGFTRGWSAPHFRE